MAVLSMARSSRAGDAGDDRMARPVQEPLRSGGASSRLTVFVVALLALYRFLFPGMFSLSTGSDQLAFSFYVRLNDFVERLDRQPAGDVPDAVLIDTPRLVDRDNDVGFSVMPPRNSSCRTDSVVPRS